MKEYIKNNWTPLVVGFAVAMIYNTALNSIVDVILKLALINTASVDL